MAKRKTTDRSSTLLTVDYDGLLTGISELLARARVGVARTANSILTATYWDIGRRIVEFEQGGQARAEYGDVLLKRLGKDLSARCGRGYGWRNLFNMRAFYLGWEILQTPSAKFAIRVRGALTVTEAKANQKLQTPSAIFNEPSKSAPFEGQLTQLASLTDFSPGNTFSIPTLATAFPLSWSQYVRLLSVDDPYARAFYETEAIRGGWSVRQLDRQISTQFYQRLALSKRKTAMLEKALVPLPEDAVTVEDVIRDPYLLEFLNLKDEYSESDLEEAIIRHLEWFLLELGEGFAFVARQKRIRIGDTWYRIDLLLYHRDLRCLVIVDLKIGKFTHADAGQMNLYLNYAGEHMTRAGESPPVGIILCSEKDDAVVKYATGGIKTQVFASKYLEVLPDAEKLRQEILSTQRAFAAHDAGRPKTDTKGTKRKPT